MSADASSFDGKAFVATVTTSPGVYRMLNAKGDLLYVGKARNLRKRLGSYFLKPPLDPRIASMVLQIGGIEVTLTRTESEALLLEAQLIKSLKPRYNVMLRDDKSYPYIFVSEEPLPRFVFHRGPRRANGRYFGPYPNAQMVRESLALLQKLFKVRLGWDGTGRSRAPGLLYQIGRAHAPRDELIDPVEYAEDVRHAVMFLEGRNEAVLEHLVANMDAASEHQDYERAARLRDRVAMLRGLLAQSHILGVQTDMDVFASRIKAGVACVSVLFFRHGANVGSRNFFPNLPLDATPASLLGQFIAQYYLDQPPPSEVLCGRKPADAAALAEMLSARRGRQVAVKWHVRGERARFLELAARNAEAGLTQHLASRQTLTIRFNALRELLDLEETPRHVECFDISHTMGEATVASCVAFGPDGPMKALYRRFSIRGITGGDDYAAMRQALQRHFTRVAGGEGERPDVLLIDGGKGQVTQALDVLRDLELSGIEVVGVAKGPSRRAGEETLVLGNSGRLLEPGPDSPALQLIDAIRDEAHRFAITSHRRRREKARQHSGLEDIPGIGAVRRTALLKAFGGYAGVAAAGVEEISVVPGVGRGLAERIHALLHA